MRKQHHPVITRGQQHKNRKWCWILAEKLLNADTRRGVDINVKKNTLI
jgi:hypothetical protein